MVQQQDMELEGMNPDEDILRERVAFCPANVLTFAGLQTVHECGSK